MDVPARSMQNYLARLSSGTNRAIRGTSVAIDRSIADHEQLLAQCVLDRLDYDEIVSLLRVKGCATDRLRVQSYINSMLCVMQQRSDHFQCSIRASFSKGSTCEIISAELCREFGFYIAPFILRKYSSTCVSETGSSASLSLCNDDVLWEGILAHFRNGFRFVFFFNLVCFRSIFIIVWFFLRVCYFVVVLCMR